MKQAITIFTDGSCHTQIKTGGWASIILHQGEKIILEGTCHKTTHQRMELTAVLESLKYLQLKNLIEEDICIYSDSQYVVDFLRRKEKLRLANFQTKKLKPIRNADLVHMLMAYIDYPNIQFQKIKSHQKLSSNESYLNREVDLLSKKNMRGHR
ncbi:RNase H family protein [Chryseolinea sp. H1M3-3]|uniref:RNase H family protein n=1 Tax=Chryseolinea sp. H1M3-3 TaxID=3034144 RepID=UPI0023ED8892|nr:RNase H family protein [Chryseolinea sp. H1M3-3]